MKYHIVDMLQLSARAFVDKTWALKSNHLYWIDPLKLEKKHAKHHKITSQVTSFHTKFSNHSSCLLSAAVLLLMMCQLSVPNGATKLVLILQKSRWTSQPAQLAPTQLCNYNGHNRTSVNKAGPGSFSTKINVVKPKIQNAVPLIGSIMTSRCIGQIHRPNLTNNSRMLLGI